MPLYHPDCGCPFPYRVQIGNAAIGREVRYSLCCAIRAMEEMTGRVCHEILWDTEPGAPRPESSSLESGKGGPKPFLEWDFAQRVVAEKRAMGFNMEGC